MQETYSGTVIRGEGRGRTIGYPTANIDINELEIEYKQGVYSSFVSLGNNHFNAILFFGPKKTFEQIEDTLEIHILNFDQDIYGETLEFTIGQFIRGPIKFNSAEELIEQIQEDISQVRK